jgi:ribosomal protein S18 acetylase RimI-like enzyme
VKTILGIEAGLGLREDLPRQLYVGRLKGEPVATSLMFLGAGVAGIYAVSTARRARRQGVGRAMTLVPLLEARAKGYRIGTLHSSPMGLSLYRQLGFQEYCRLRLYMWAGEVKRRTP